MVAQVNKTMSLAASVRRDCATLTGAVEMAAAQKHLADIARPAALARLKTDYAAIAAAAQRLSAPSSLVTQLQQQAKMAAKMSELWRPNSAVLRQFTLAQEATAAAAAILRRNASLLAAGDFALPMHRIVGSLPNVGAIASSMREDLKGREILEEAGFEVVYGWLGSAFVFGLESVAPEVRGAAVTNRLFAITRGQGFEDVLLDLCRQTPLLQRRWPILRDALAAHRRREYNLSVPVLMAQVEGMIGDALVLRSTARKVGAKFFELDSCDQVRLDKKGNPVELRGLGMKLKRFPAGSFELIDDLVAYTVSRFPDRRNSVLHGSDVRYGRAKLSTQLLLTAYMWAREIADFVS
jgi:hypothetical protein